MKIFGSILILLFAYNLISACSCKSSTEEDKINAVKNASIIFSGKVISIVPTENYQNKVKFHVLKSWKGLETNEIVVTTSSESSACGVNFTVGETRTVYSFSNPPSTSSCSMMLVDGKLVREMLGEGKNFEDLPAPQAETKETEGFFTWLWRKITSIFS